MAIYPIVKGQQPNRRISIPPRGSISGLSSRATATPAASNEGDLIDFGQNEASSPAGPPPPLDTSHKSTTEIQTMLSATGTRANTEGSLIDFHEDMKKSLPAGVKRTDTSESNDEFVDAQV